MFAIEEILVLAKQKMNQMNFKKFTYKHRVLNVAADSKLSISAYSQFWFLKKAGYGVSISSDFGFTGNEIPSTNEQVFEHTGSIEISNCTNKSVQLEFVQVIPIN